ncbi:IgGFc-binding protein [Varanus komodoensis]|nr:IgGFc-binding protein [Varanus komodoensis]
MHLQQLLPEDTPELENFRWNAFNFIKELCKRLPFSLPAFSIGWTASCYISPTSLSPEPARCFLQYEMCEKETSRRGCQNLNKEKKKDFPHFNHQREKCGLALQHILILIKEVMATRWLPFWTWLALLCGPCGTSSCGQEFITAFMENNGKMQPNAKFELLITGHHPGTTVTVTVQKSNFQRDISVDAGQTVSIELPTSIEMVGTQIFDHTVRIQADKEISVLSRNYKHQTSATTAVYPVQQLGKEYYAITPMGDRANTFKEFAILAYTFPTRVDVHLKGSVIFKGQVYPAGSRLVVDLDSFQAIQLQSSVDLSGSRIESKEPVAVLSGHSCAWKFTSCDHVVEQLLPVSSWGNTSIVPPLPFYSRLDTLYIIASKVTCIKIQSGNNHNSHNVVAGQVLKLDEQLSHPIYVSADAGIQIIFFFPGSTRENEVYDPFMINIPALTSYCMSYHIDGMAHFHNYAVLIANTSESSGITIQKEAIMNVQWKPVQGTQYSWGDYSLGTEATSLSVQHPSTPFGLLVLGVAQYDGYGSVALCSCNKPVPSCSSVQCRKKEKCEIINGQPVCVPESESTCWAQGDPHYYTFDGRKFDFMGTCTYIIARTCGQDVSLPSFSIVAKNENRGNPHVSYIALVTATIYNVTISVARYEVGFVRVNNQRTRLPISLNDGKLRLYQYGGSAFIETDFSLRVSYDWNSYLVVKISSSFWESVCGLCGNYNGDPTDDFRTPEGNLAPSPVQFGKSWKVEDGDRFCWDDCHGECKSCPPEMVIKYKDEPFCGWISKVGDGPFSQCHSVVDPSIFLENCVYDLCLNDGLKHVLCEALKNYAEACQKEGAAVSDWRSLTALSCPENSHYEACGPPCPTTCNAQAGPQNCSTLPCVETCQCNGGFVLDAGRCVPESACGCLFEGKLYSPGEQFWGDAACTKRCTCDAETKQVTCQATGCKSGEQCRVEDGIQNCYPTSYATCSASGDPHYITFDGLKFDFQGTCVYQFTGLCEKRTDLVDFLVLVQNDHRGSQAVSFTRDVEIYVYETSIVISRRNPAKVMVNGLLTNLPYYTESKRISIHRQGQEAVIETDFGLTVTFDWQSRVTVTVPSTYANTLCGLCGNFNGNKQDELTMKNGTVAPSPSAFGQSWKMREVPGCTEVDKGECADLAAIEKQQRQLGKECGLILAKDGPFRECHSKIDPEGYFQDCVYDYCFFEGQQTVICQLISSYAAACQAAGAVLYEWRSDTFCSKCNSPEQHCRSLLCMKVLTAPLRRLLLPFSLQD